MKSFNGFPIILLAATTALSIACNQAKEQEEANIPINSQAATTTAAPPQPSTGKEILLGNWTRTDAPYEIKITELLADGSMKAGYFNPQPINVGKANWTDSGNVIKVYIELRDTNYPGSNYTLYYIPGKDMLAGKYFQAVESTTFDVGFMRSK